MDVVQAGGVVPMAVTGIVPRRLTMRLEMSIRDRNASRAPMQALLQQMGALPKPQTRQMGLAVVKQSGVFRSHVIGLYSAISY